MQWQGLGHQQTWAQVPALFLINNISKSYFPLEIHIKEGARWLEYFLLLVLSEEELFYVPYRDDSVIFLFYLSTNPFIHPFIYLHIIAVYAVGHELPQSCGT